MAHRPDEVLAAAPLSGYLSIGLYVPSTLWSQVEPQKRAVVDFALATHRNELFTPNFVDKPIYQQHGMLDDNVPVFHSSLIHRLINETGSKSAYDVVPGRGHWWDGVLS